MRNSARAGAPAHLLALVFMFVTLAGQAHAGHDIQSMVAWATDVKVLVRGPIDIAHPGDGLASYGVEADVVGAAAGDELSVLSLGDHGTITLSFDIDIGGGSGSGIGNGIGDDFAVFENGLWTEEGLFAEFAFVEVSSNGVDFAGFAPVSYRALPVPAFGVVDPADYERFAGDEPSGLGTGFDLSLLTNHPLVQSGQVDLHNIFYVRLTDVIGDGSTVDAYLDPVYDPYPTLFASSGFDLDGVGVLNVPEPTSAALWLSGLLSLAGLARHSRSTRRA
jgi:hypothetical protein